MAFCAWLPKKLDGVVPSAQNRVMYEVFEHTADLGLRVRASSLDQLFTDAAKGLLSMFVANPESVRSVRIQQVELTADSLDLLLVDWLSEILFLFDVEGMLLSRFSVRVRQQHLVAECSGEAVDGRRHELDHEVKAITYHNLILEQAESGWRAEVIVDI